MPSLLLTTASAITFVLFVGFATIGCLGLAG